MKDFGDLLSELFALASSDGWFRPLVYLALGMTYGLLAQSSRVTRWSQPSAQRAWALLGGVYLLVAASNVLNGEQLFIHWAREQLHTLQLYEVRRWLQFPVLIAFGLFALRFVQTRLLLVSWSTVSLATTSLTLGVTCTVLLYATHYVSFHYTDQFLASEWFGWSLSFWLEMAALVMAGAGTWMEFVQRYRSD